MGRKNIENCKYNLIIGNSHVLASVMARTAKEARDHFKVYEGYQLMRIPKVSVKKAPAEEVA